MVGWWRGVGHGQADVIFLRPVPVGALREFAIFEASKSIGPGFGCTVHQTPVNERRDLVQLSRYKMMTQMATVDIVL